MAIDTRLVKPLKFAGRSQQRRQYRENLYTLEQTPEPCHSVFACYLALCVQENYQDSE